MNHGLSLALAFALSFPQQLLAADTPAQGLDLRDHVLTTVIYSRESNRVLVGLLAANNVLHFEECTVPNIPLGQPVTLDRFANCSVVEGSAFLADEATVERVNMAFPALVNQAFEDLQHAENKKIMGDARFAKKYYVPAASISMLVGIGLTYRGLQRSGQSFSLGRTGQGMGYGALGIAGAVVTAASIYAAYHATESQEKMEVRPIEDSAAEGLKSLIADGLIPADTKFPEMADGALYESIRLGLLKSIETGFTF